MSRRSAMTLITLLHTFAWIALGVFAGVTVCELLATLIRHWKNRP
jgi:hypothetical protein